MPQTLRPLLNNDPTTSQSLLKLLEASDTYFDFNKVRPKGQSLKNPAHEDPSLTELLERVAVFCKEQTPISSLTTPNTSDSDAVTRARTFMTELLNSVETLEGIVEEHGSRTLADLLYLQQAIITGGYIDHYPNESAVLALVQALPSGKQWETFIKIEAIPSGN